MDLKTTLDLSEYLAKFFTDETNVNQIKTASITAWALLVTIIDRTHVYDNMIPE